MPHIAINDGTYVNPDHLDPQDPLRIAIEALSELSRIKAQRDRLREEIRSRDRDDNNQWGGGVSTDKEVEEVSRYLQPGDMTGV